MKKHIAIFLFVISLFCLACKSKSCANFESNDKGHKLKYDRQGHVIK
ncbi:MAG: hypothetical protein H7296_03290 [Bacteroidia bacterium]|nr:hypothetical protein [Bacteroidia bacterium]